ncbi:hypothetical protein [Novosphingobium rosa]|uniref:hypothetical protein n=1 Tax=Novosphingobium rosa TaxID=76978 RepID=UPI000832C406|nr:hypothetical protein [Novosphingobium rosa]
MLPLLLMFAQAPVQDAAANSPLLNQWAQFSRAGALNRVRETVDIATGESPQGAPFAYRLRFTRQAPANHGRGRQTRVQWADSASCPAIRPVMAAMGGITMPRPAPYGVPGQEMTIVMDGAIYTLSVPSSDAGGEIRISSNVGSSLADWVDRSLEALAPCWKAQP